MRGLAMLVAAAAGMTWAQEPAFEAASVKRIEVGTRGGAALHGGPGTGSPGRLTGEATMRGLLVSAFLAKGYEISGPAWMMTERYELDAALGPGATKGQVAAMLRRLLQERFGLVTHLETKDGPVYALLVAKGGSKLKAAAADGAAETSAPKLVTGSDGLLELAEGATLARSYEVAIGGPDGVRYRHWGRRETMEQLAARLASQFNRPVLDETGLEGAYDFTLTWTLESAGGMIPRTDSPPDEIYSRPNAALADGAIDLAAALQQQLGLRLEQRRAPVTVVVIDRLEKTPSGN